MRNERIVKKNAAGRSAGTAVVFLLLMLVMLLSAGTAIAQTEPDPAVLDAKEKTAVVYDLGRFFGYVHSMITEEKSLELTTEQKREIVQVMEEVREMKRIEPDWAEETLEYLELDVLSPAQLMEVDRRAIEWQNNRGTDNDSGGQTAGGGVPGSGAGAGSGSGPISSFVAGGPFNPILDDSKSIGQGFAELFTYLE